MRILTLMKMLLEETDEQHRLTLETLAKKLNTTKKTIKTDIAKLQQFGIAIVMQDEKYYVNSRLFENAELKLLIDAVQASRCITLAKSQKLIKKIESLTSVHEANKLAEQVFVVSRNKTTNEEIFFNINQLYEAIAKQQKIAFHYFTYNVKREVQLRNNGEKYIVSPYALSWDDENYYLIANYAKHEGLTHFRVDKMLDIEILSEKCLADDDEAFNAADYQKRIFSMFGGNNISVTIEFDHSLMNVVIDRFGKDIITHSETDTSFQITTKIAVSPAFYGWIFQFGDKTKIISPASVVQDMKKMLTHAAKLYE